MCGNNVDEKLQTTHIISIIHYRSMSLIKTRIWGIELQYNGAHIIIIKLYTHVLGDGEEDRFRFLGGQTRGPDERVSIIRPSRRLSRALLQAACSTATHVRRPSVAVASPAWHRADPFYVMSNNNNGTAAAAAEIIFIRTCRELT